MEKDKAWLLNGCYLVLGDGWLLAKHVLKEEKDNNFTIQFTGVSFNFCNCETNERTLSIKYYFYVFLKELFLEVFERPKWSDSMKWASPWRLFWWGTYVIDLEFALVLFLQMSRELVEHGAAAAPVSVEAMRTRDLVHLQARLLIWAQTTLTHWRCVTTLTHSHTATHIWSERNLQIGGFYGHTQFAAC